MRVTGRRMAMVQTGDNSILLPHQQTIAIPRMTTFAVKWRPQDDNWTVQEATGLRKLTTASVTLTAIEL